MIVIKSDAELAAMRESGRLAAEVRDELARRVAPGVTTGELGDYAEELIRGRGAESAFFGYRGYPGQICVSVNDEVVHGIPGRRRIELGDVVSLDVGVRYGGFIGDTAVTVMVGVTARERVNLVRVAERALEAGIAKAVAGNRLSDISHAVEQTVREAGLGIVRDFVGHGVGRDVHEDPQVPNVGRPGRGPRLRKGMTLAIEPMVTLGDGAVEVLADGWTVKTRDRRAAAHVEHTVAVRDREAEVLTRP